MNKVSENEFHNANNKKVQKKEGPFYFLIWFFKIEFFIILIFFMIWLTIRLVPEEKKYLLKYQLGKHFISNTSNEQSPDDLYNAIKNNEYLDKENKIFIESIIKQEVEENIKYIDEKSCYKKLKTLEVNFNSSSKYNKNDGIHFAGDYNQFLNIIDIYDEVDNLNLSNCNKEAYFHELNHLLSKNDITSAFEMEIFSEILNELFTREYFNALVEDNSNKAYEEYMIYAYAFAELLPEDTLRKYKFYENNNILISALLEIDDNFDQVYKLLNSLKIENINQRQKEFHDSYEYFYEKKYGEKIYTNTNLMLYFYNTLVQNSEEKRIIEEYLKENEIDNVYRIIPKGYFSKEYKKANPYITIIYFSENKLNVFEVK